MTLIDQAIPRSNRRHYRRHKNGTPGRTVSLQTRLTHEEWAYLDGEAAARKLKVGGLVGMLVEAVTRDKMVKAVLDD